MKRLMKQTEEIFKNGYVTSNGGRGKIANAGGNAYANGTAYVNGSWGGGRWNINYGAWSGYTPTVVNKAPVQKQQTEAKNEYKETVDFIEMLIDRIERKIDELDTKANSAFRTFGDRADALSQQFSKVTEEIEIQKKAYEAYMQKANSISLSQDYKNKVMSGELRIEDITDEDLNDKISDFEDWFEKALDCNDAIIELNETLGEIVQTNFDNVSSEFDALVDNIEHEISILEGQLDIIENKGNFAGKAYYEALAEKEQKNIDKLNEQYKALVKARDEALASGSIKEGSEAWNDMTSEIHDVEEAYQDATNALLEYKNEMREMDWSIFEKAQEYISDLTNESDFIKDLLSVNENDLFNKDTGELNTAGMTTGALSAMNYNVYMAQADEYAKKIQEINAELAKDPTNTILLDKRNEYLEAQRESIQNANEEKQAIQDLISDSYDRQLESLQELIDKRKEYLENERDIYEYQKDIQEQTKNIADLEKQLASLQGDTSEEANSKRQQISSELEQSRSDLEDMTYDQYIQDQERVLDEFYSEYETFLNGRLDNIDGLLQEMIDYGNFNAGVVNETINTATSNVGYQITDGMNTIWTTAASNISGSITDNKNNFNSVMSDYKNTFTTQMTTVNSYIKGIFDLVQKSVNGKVTVSTPSGNTSSSSGGSIGSSSSSSNISKPPTSTPQQPAKKQPTIGGLINAGSAPIYSYAGDRNGLHQYFSSDPIYKVLDEKNGYLLVRWHGRNDGYTGWFKKSDVTALNTGGYTGNYEGMAMLHKKERVLSAQQTRAYDDFVYKTLPSIQAQFGNVAKNGIQSGGGTVNSTMDVTFNLPNVTDTNTFMKELQSNKKFEKLVQSMTIDRLVGKNSLSKNKIRF